MGAYRTAACIGLGIAHLILGSLAVMLNGLGLSKIVEAHSLGGVGIWGGLLFFIPTGIAAIIAGIAPKHMHFVIWLILSALSSGIALLLTVAAGIGVNADHCGCKGSEYYRKWYLKGYDNQTKRAARVAINSSLILLGIFETSIAVVSTVYAAILVRRVNEQKRRSQNKENPEMSVPGLPVPPSPVSILPRVSMNPEGRHAYNQSTASQRKYVPGLPYNVEPVTSIEQPQGMAGQPTLSPEGVITKEIRKSIYHSQEVLNPNKSTRPSKSRKNPTEHALKMNDFSKSIDAPSPIESVCTSLDDSTAVIGPNNAGISKTGMQKLENTAGYSDDEVFIARDPRLTNFQPIHDLQRDGSPANTIQSDDSQASRISAHNFGGRKPVTVPRPHYPPQFGYPETFDSPARPIQYRPMPSRRPPGYVPSGQPQWTVHRYYYFPSASAPSPSEQLIN